jgi:hypothetical protein
VLGFAMKLAPYGVAGLIYTVTAKLGIDVIKALGFYVGVAIFGLLCSTSSSCWARSSRSSRASEPLPLLRAHPRAHGHRLLDVLLERDAADDDPHRDRRVRRARRTSRASSCPSARR